MLFVVRRIAVLLAPCALLAACGGDGSNPSSSSGQSSSHTPDPPGHPDGVPRAVDVARATDIPACTVFVDASNGGAADGSVARPHKTITAAVDAAKKGAVICVAEGTYRDALAPGLKYFTLAGGFQSGKRFEVRDSSRFVTKALGDGSNTFLLIDNEGPKDGELTAVDGFEITGYAQAVVRDIYYAQRFDLTNNHIHDNACLPGAFGGGFFLKNVLGTVSGNVIARNTCGFGGAGALNDSTGETSVVFSRNLVDSNVGDADSSHGGGFYLLAKDITLLGNTFVGNEVSGWGGGLYVGALAALPTTARLRWNVYRENRAAIFGGGFFCDDGARCLADHEIYAENCAGNVFLDNGEVPTVASFDHTTNYRALAPDCSAPWAGVIINKQNTSNDSYSFVNSIFWGNEKNHDFDASCDQGCSAVEVKVSFSLVQTKYANGGVTVSFGEGNVAPTDPRFVDAAGGDFHLRSRHGHWTPKGYVKDDVDSPALAAGDPAGATDENPAGAGDRTELGAYGNGPEASLVE
jgi:hypothetical protein